MALTRVFSTSNLNLLEKRFGNFLPFRSLSSTTQSGNSPHPNRNSTHSNNYRKNVGRASTADPSFNLFKILSEEDSKKIGKGNGKSNPVKQLKEDVFISSSSSSENEDNETFKRGGKRNWNDVNKQDESLKKLKKERVVEINSSSVVMDQDGEGISFDRKYEETMKYSGKDAKGK